MLCDRKKPARVTERCGVRSAYELISLCPVVFVAGCHPRLECQPLSRSLAVERSLEAIVSVPGGCRNRVVEFVQPLFRDKSALRRSWAFADRGSFGLRRFSNRGADAEAPRGFFCSRDRYADPDFFLRLVIRLLLPSSCFTRSVKANGMNWRFWLRSSDFATAMQPRQHLRVFPQRPAEAVWPKKSASLVRMTQA